ncbi:MAG: hypothetical protein KKE39_02380 [Bacteroidetes bacterium]|nr:hypothetical protein [Bacteroidota bacterium]MBU1374138.1 hypothetical protein [Bacteroidota bacterium]MBU1484749.1 hypothetical protein [Bacteroidota bacterium]MBU1760148.1 hypothetical protein [Bacteroidota bacterium]MBU2045598.1 hypothetical protein [Bacteroidota bacterium]
MTVQYHHFFELLSFILSIVFYQSLKEKKLEAFAPFLGITVVVEVLAANWHIWSPRNDILYNIYLLISYPFQLAVFKNVLQLNQKQKLIFNIFSFLFILVAAFSIIFLTGIFTFNNYYYMSIQLVNICFSVLILFKIVTNDDKDYSLLKNPYFWIFGACFLFGLGSLSVVSLRQLILNYNLMINGKHIYQVIMPFLIVILYTSYSYGFYLCKKQVTK